MTDRPTLEHTRLTALELNGRPIEIASAELVRIQYWRGDEPAQQEWEVTGRTHDEEFRDGTQSIVIAIGDERFKGRVVLSSSRSYGLAVFMAVGLGELVRA
jgi:hypothetical protein